MSALAPIGVGEMFVLTGDLGLGAAPGAHRRLYRVSEGRVREVADLGAFEEAVNPDKIWNSAEPESNPYNLAELKGNELVVADAAGNSLIHVAANGALDWVAVLTPRVVPTAPLKQAAGCPNGPPPICGLPPQLPAEPVATSVAVGRDSAIYAGELIGFPATPGYSRIWRIAAGSRHAVCPSAACTLFADGLTSIVDLTMSPDGRTLWAVELDAAGWLAVEFGGGVPAAGGRVQSCAVATGACTVRASGLPLPTALTFAKDGTPWLATNTGLRGGTSTVRPLF